MGAAMICFFQNFYFNKKKSDILQNSKVINHYITSAIRNNNLQDVKIWLEFTARINKGKVWMVNKDGYLTFSYPIIPRRNIKLNLPAYKKIFSGRVISKEINLTIFDKPMLLTGIPIKKGIDTEFALLIFTPVSGIKDTINKVITLMVYSSLLAIIMAIIISYTWSRSLSNPLKRLSDFAIHLSKGNFGSTINNKMTGKFQELDTLAKNINNMSITLKNTINKLTEEKNKLKYVLSGMEEGVIAVNASGDVILVNNSLVELLTLAQSKVNQEKYYQVIKNKNMQQMIKKVIEEKEFYSDELFIDDNGINKRVLIHLTPIYINKNKFWGIVGLFQDISERWRFEKLQQEFIANVSHDLKTPLSSIKGATELLMDGIVDTSEKRRNYLQMIHDESNRLENLVEEVLELNVFTSRNATIKIKKVEVNQLLISMKMMFEKIINKEEFLVKTVIPDKKIFVKGNREKLERILLNLLDNAYKFSIENNSIELGVEDDDDKIKLWVKDQGTGIPNDELENIWERFYKVDKARNPEQEGNGLGLSIVKRLVEAQGGSVFVESELNKGSTFGFYLNKI